MRKPRRRLSRDRLPFLHLLPNMITILGLCAGLTAIRFVMMGRYEFAASLIIFAALIDGLDGLIARRINATSQMGAELDSLSDFLNFGVAPGILIYQFALTGMRDLGWLFVLIYVICCCLRLARFNVSREEPQGVGRPHFTGVPAPAGALLALVPLFLTAEGVLNLRQMPWLVGPWLALVAWAMISRLPTPSPKAIRIRRDQVAPVLIGMVVVGGLVFTRFWLLMILLSGAYVITLGYALITRKRSGLPDPQ
ncbi:CDP-diacylglycerol--serine O-phosphatidyltransferase [Plastorhodobacter daqingensis]|uniref:CDP-diacylglycerol--serine O-phosphatidyltransferase n=1 Tax=Plastorhodobacter daqingensis TaxID=1387281 RepID=A0ABW2UMS6_9RHOB